MAKFKSLSDDAIKQNDKALADIKKIFQNKTVSPKTMEKIQKYFDKSAELKKIQQALVGTVNEVEGEVQSEAMSNQLKINKLLQAANTIEDSLNDVNLELTDDQIDKFTEMILDLRAKAKAKLTNEEMSDPEKVMTTVQKTAKINSKDEYLELVPKIIGLSPPGVSNTLKIKLLKQILQKLGK